MSRIPAINLALRTEYAPNDSFPRMVRDAQDAGGKVRQAFEKDFADIGRLASQALTRPLNSVGSLDLGADQQREAARAAQAHATALREIANAAARAALATGDTSRETARYVTAAGAAAREAEGQAREATETATAYARLQSELDRTASATAGLARAQGASAVAAGRLASANTATRMAMVGTGQQLQDIAISLYSGQRAGTVFAQQLPQLAFALSSLEGSTNKTQQSIGRFATFLSGPWGVAVGLGAGVLATMVGKLFETAEAAEKVEFATNAMGNAQGILGGVLDITTGKINTQNSALIALARAQILVAQVQAKTRAADARAQIAASGEQRLQISGGMGGGFAIGRSRPIEGQVASNFLNGVIDTDGAVKRLERLREAGRITDETFSSLAASYANLGVELANQKVFEEAEALLNGTGGRGLLKPAKAGASKRTKTSRDNSEATGARLAEFAEDAAKNIASIRNGFNETPAAIARAQDAMGRLNDLASDIGRRLREGLDPKVAAELAAEIEALRPVIEQSVNQPFRDMVDAARERAEIDGLILQNLPIEAEIRERQLRLEERQGALSAEQLATLRATVIEEGSRAKAIERQNELQRRQIDFLDTTRDNLRQTTVELLQGRGVGAIGNLFKRQQEAALQRMADEITEGLFGDMFRDEKDRILGFDKVQEASKRTVKSSDEASNSILDLAQAARSAANALGGVAANDNSALAAEFDAVFAHRIDEITVVGQKSTGRIVKDTLKGVGKSIFGEDTFGKISGAINTGLQGAAIGQFSSGLAKSLGLKQSSLGSQLGGAVGMAVGGPIGALVGGFLGGTIGGLFKKNKTGKAQIGADEFGNLAVTGITGSSGKMKTAASGAGDSVLAAVESIADALGGTVNAALGSVTVGVRNGKYRVDPTGGGNTKTSKGAIDFGKDGAEAAIKYATMDLIKDGVLEGLRASTQRLLQTGKDLDTAISKAVRFQSVFDRLDEIKDPVGAAIRGLNREFEGLIKIFGEAGASAAEYAQLEELYGLERAKAVKAANDNIASSLKSLLDDLTFRDETLSLTDRKAYAAGRFNPLADRVRAGDVTAFDDFAEASAAMLEIERQLSGSQSAYFALRDQVLDLTRSAIDRQEALASTSGGLSDPFTGGTAGTSAITGALAANGQTIVEGLGYKLDAINENLGTLITQTPVQQAAPLDPLSRFASGMYW